MPDWNHTTSLELDSAFLFAVPICLVIKNIFLSVGIANILMAAVYILVVSDILIHAKVQRRFIYLTLCLILTPWSYGMLEYFNMMFYGGACYSVKTLIPLLFILLVQILSENRLDTGRRRAEFVAAAALYAVFLFATAFSTGFYAVLCGVCPLVLYMLLDIWVNGCRTGKYRKAHLGLIAVTFVIFAAGYLLHTRYYTGVSRTHMLLTKTENYAINLRACVAGIFQVFGALTSEDIEALSPWGIVYCLKIGFVMLVLAVLLYHTVRIFRKNDALDVSKYMAIVFLFNFLLLVVTDCRYTGNTHIEYRYYLIGAVPLLVLTGIQSEEWVDRCDPVRRKILTACIWLFLAVILAGNHKNVADKWDRTTYAVEFCDYVKNLDVESVIFINDSESAKICKGIDHDHKYGAYMTETQSFDLSICSYYQSASGAFYGNKNILAVIEGNDLAALLPAEIAAHYEKIGSVRWFDIYYSDQVYFP